jgi:hypothetical protein
MSAAAFFGVLPNRVSRLFNLAARCGIPMQTFSRSFSTPFFDARNFSI